MKKILAIVSMAAMVAGAAFAADVSATVKMDANLASGGKDADTQILTLKAKDQKDSDALVFDFAGEKAGAHFQMWYNYPEGTVSARSTSVWFKPIDQIKVTVGYASQSLYKERINWWKVAVGNSATDASGWANGGQWSSATGIDGQGFNVTVTPIEGLSIDLGFAPGKDASAFVLANEGDNKLAAWGTTIKYQMLPEVSAGIAYRDNGTDSFKIITAGVDYNGNGIYGFLQPRFYFNGDFDLDGVAIDNYISYASGALSIAGRFPYTLRLTKVDTDPSYMIYEVKVAYALTGLTPYLKISNDGNREGFTPLKFGKDTLSVGKTFAIDVNPGVSLNVGECALDISAEFWTIANDGGYGWALPFTASVSF